jgi:hypothetical protein
MSSLGVSSLPTINFTRNHAYGKSYYVWYWVRGRIRWLALSGYILSKPDFDELAECIYRSARLYITARTVKAIYGFGPQELIVDEWDRYLECRFGIKRITHLTIRESNYTVILLPYMRNLRYLTCLSDRDRYKLQIFIPKQYNPKLISIRSVSAEIQFEDTGSKI